MASWRTLLPLTATALLAVATISGAQTTPAPPRRRRRRPGPEWGT